MFEVVALIDTGKPEGPVTLKYHKPIGTLSLRELYTAARKGSAAELLREAVERANIDGEVIGVYLTGRGIRRLRRMLGLPRFVRFDSHRGNAVSGAGAGTEPALAGATDGGEATPLHSCSLGGEACE